MEVTAPQIREVIENLLEGRQPQATICPSEAARHCASGSPKPSGARARERVDRAKQALGERGPVWWTDGAPDCNRKLAKNTPYRDWFSGLPGPVDPGPRPPPPTRRLARPAPTPRSPRPS